MEKLKKIREKKGLSQNKLAEFSGINVRILQNYEQGVRNLDGAKLVTLLQLCKALDCKLSDIISDAQTLKLLKEVYPNDT